MQRRNWPTQKKVENLTRKLSNNMIPGHQGVILLNTIERRRGLTFLCLRGRLQHPTEIRWCKTDAKQENVSTMGSKDDPFSVVKGRCSDRRELMRDQGRCHHCHSNQSRILSSRESRDYRYKHHHSCSSSRSVKNAMTDCKVELMQLVHVTSHHSGQGGS
jgi:hypothetical protein